MYLDVASAELFAAAFRAQLRKSREWRLIDRRCIFFPPLVSAAYRGDGFRGEGLTVDLFASSPDATRVSFVLRADKWLRRKQPPFGQSPVELIAPLVDPANPPNQ